MIRAFVGIALAEPVVDALVAVQAGLPAGRAVNPGNLHLTLVFLGEHQEPVIEDVHFALAALQAPAFELRLAGLGLFSDRPRIVHAEVCPEPRLKHLRDRVFDAARGCGLKLQRERFHPHVTIARLGTGVWGDEAERLRRFVADRSGFRAGPFTVRRFILYRSFLGRNGPSYEELASYHLAGDRTQ